MSHNRRARASPYRPVLRHPVLRRVLPGFTISSLGDGMALVAVSWLAIELAPPADRGPWVAAAAAAYTISAALGAVLLGRLLSRRSPARLAGWDATLRACTLGAIPVLYMFSALSIQVYVGLLAVSSLMHSWGQAGTYTLLARVLPQRDHLAGNAVLSSIGSFSTVLGPPLAGLIIIIGGPATVLAIDAATFLVLALIFLAVPKGSVPEPKKDDDPRAAGFSVIRRTPALLSLLTLSSAFFFLFGPVYVALPLHVSEDRHASASLLAAFYSAFGIGAVLGSLVTGFLNRWPMWPTTIGIVITFGIFMLPIGLGAPTVVALCSFAVAGLLWPPYASLSMTLFQRSTPSAQLPQVLAAKSAVWLLSVPLGTALGGPLVGAVGPVQTLRFSAGAISVLGLMAAGVFGARTVRLRRNAACSNETDRAQDP